MTLIAATVHEGQVFMLGDSLAGSHGGYPAHLVRTPKVFALDDLLIGYTTSFRMGQLLEFGLKFPARKVPLDVWMRSTFIEKVRTTFEKGGFGDAKNDTGGQFLVGVEGRIFEVQADFSVMEYAVPYAAIGSGEYHARTALYVLHRSGAYHPDELLLEAARVTRAHMPTVAPPWHLIRSGAPGVRVVEQ